MNVALVFFRPLVDLERVSEIAVCYRSDKTRLRFGGAALLDVSTKEIRQPYAANCSCVITMLKPVATMGFVAECA
jgi:hypothetical protein